MSKPVNEEVLKEIELFLEKNVPTNPSKWSYYKSQAKKKFDVYPSAYANAWAAKMYKKAGGGWRTKKESIEEFQRDRQLRDPKKEMLIVKNGKVIVINKKDFDKYKRKGWIVAESVNEEKNIKVTFRSKAAKQRYMKKQSLRPNSPEIVNQTDTSLTLTPDMKDYVSKKSHSDLIYQVDMVGEVNQLTGEIDVDYDIRNAKKYLKDPHTIKDILYNKTRRGEKYVKIVYTKDYVPGKMMDTGPHFVSVFYNDKNDLKKIGKALKLKLKESMNERYRPNFDSKGYEAAQKVIRQLQSSVFRKLDDDELLEFRKAIADAFNLDGILK